MAIDTALKAIIDAKAPPATAEGSGAIYVADINDLAIAIAQFYQNKRVVSVAVTGSGTTRSLVVTLGDGSTLESDFTLPEGGPVLTFHFGNPGSGATPTEGEIEALPAQSIPSGGAKVIQFANGTDAYMAFAYPATEPDPTTYYIGPLDNGTLGTDGTFAAPVTVGAYRVILSNYATQIPDPVTFS